MAKYKNKIFIEEEVKGRDFILICSPDAPLSDAYEAVKLLEQEMINRLKAVQPAEEPQEQPAEV